MSAAPVTRATVADSPSATARRPAATRPASYGLASFYRQGSTASGEKLNGREFTAAHRTLPFGTRVRVTNVSGRGENSVRIEGSAQGRVRDIHFENIDVTLDRWTKYKGGLWDNRPTTATEGIEIHGTCGYSVRHADRVTLQNCKLSWGQNRPDYFTHALEAEDVTELKYPGFVGEAAHPERDKAIVVR